MMDETKKRLTDGSSDDFDGIRTDNPGHHDGYTRGKVGLIGPGGQLNRSVLQIEMNLACSLM